MKGKILGVEYREYCGICTLIQSSSDLTLFRDNKFIVIVHPKPFNNGHLIIATVKHLSLNEVKDDELTLMFDLTRRLMNLLEKIYTPHGFNIIINHEPHVNIQLVPRWIGDVSFVTISSSTRVVPETPYDTFKNLKELVVKYIHD